MLATHLGHGEPGEEGDLRRGRRYAVARRLAGCSRRTPCSARPCSPTGGRAATPTAPAARSTRPRPGSPSSGGCCVAAGRCPAAATGGTATSLEALRDAARRGRPARRLSMFGHTRMPVTEVELLRALGELRDVHLWLPHPSPALWDALAGAAPAPVPRRDDERRAGRPPAAGLAGPRRPRAAADRWRRSRRCARRSSAGRATRPATLLGGCSATSRANATVDPATARARRRDDRSVQVHACHGPARQVEVLREVLVGLLADDPTLEPRDILVMCPDIEAYAPLFAAAFGLGETVGGGHPGHQLRVRLADRALTQTNPLLARGRRSSSTWPVAGPRRAEVLDLLAARAGAPPLRVRRRRPRDDHRLGRARPASAGASTPSTASRSGWGGFAQNTWRAGLDRRAARGGGPTTPTRCSVRRCRSTTSAAPASSWPAGSPSCVDRLARRCRPARRQPTGGRMARRAVGDGVDALTAVARGDEWQAGAGRPGARRRSAADARRRSPRSSCGWPTCARCSPSGSPAGRPGPTSAPAP